MFPALFFVVSLLASAWYAGHRLGWWPRLQRWLAVELDYQQTTKAEVARDLLREVVDEQNRPKLPEPRPLVRLHPPDSTPVLTFYHPALRRKWGKR